MRREWHSERQRSPVLIAEAITVIGCYNGSNQSRVSEASSIRRSWRTSERGTSSHYTQEGLLPGSLLGSTRMSGCGGEILQKLQSLPPCLAQALIPLHLCLSMPLPPCAFIFPSLWICSLPPSLGCLFPPARLLPLLADPRQGQIWNVEGTVCEWSVLKHLPKIISALQVLLCFSFLILKVFCF